jgi:hypothetical protein
VHSSPLRSVRIKKSEIEQQFQGQVAIMKAVLRFFLASLVGSHIMNVGAVVSTFSDVLFDVQVHPLFTL